MQAASKYRDGIAQVAEAHIIGAAYPLGYFFPLRKSEAEKFSV